MTIRPRFARTPDGDTIALGPRGRCSVCGSRNRHRDGCPEADAEPIPVWHGQYLGTAWDESEALDLLREAIQYDGEIKRNYSRAEIADARAVLTEIREPWGPVEVYTLEIPDLEEE